MDRREEPVGNLNDLYAEAVGVAFVGIARFNKAPSGWCLNLNYASVLDGPLDERLLLSLLESNSLFRLN